MTETVWVVAANYGDDPHPHVEAVFTDEDSAESLSEQFKDPTAGMGPIAWAVEEMEVDDD